MDVIAELVAALGAWKRSLQGEAVPDRNRHDWIHFPPTLPRALLLPATTAKRSPFVCGSVTRMGSRWCLRGA